MTVSPPKHESSCDDQYEPKYVKPASTSAANRRTLHSLARTGNAVLGNRRSLAAGGVRRANIACLRFFFSRSNYGIDCAPLTVSSIDATVAKYILDTCDKAIAPPRNC